MNREIKFRGKSVDNGEWVYGDLMHNAHRNERASILYVPRVIAFPGQICNVPIIKDTICQFTGLHDSDGKEIYAGDILSQGQDLLGVACISMRYGISVKKKTTTWSLINFVLDSDFDTSVLSDVEVVGNIYDNPEMVKGGK